MRAVSPFHLSNPRQPTSRNYPARQCGRARWRMLAACFVVLGLAYPALVRAEERQFEPSMGADAFQWGPRTDGETVVWSERATNDVRDSDIYGARLSDGLAFPIATGPMVQQEPDIDDGLVVWWEEQVDEICVGCNRNVFGKVLATGEEFAVAANPDVSEQSPAISGDWVVWLQEGGIWTRNIGGTRHGQPLGEPLLLYDMSEGYSWRPPLVFDNERLVWADYLNGDGWRFRIRTMKIGETSPRTLVEEYGYTGSPHGFDLSGDVLVYTNGVFWLEALNPASGEQLAQIDGAAENREPTTDGRHIFFRRGKLLDGELVFDLWGFDLLTRALFPVSIGTEWVGLADTASGVVVWSRRLSDDISRVYAAQISDVLPSARQPTPDETGPNLMYFSETGHTLIYGFKGFWERNGGLPVFGFPMTQEFQVQQSDGVRFATAQYFERQRFEWHPELQGTPYEVLLGRLGAEDAERRGLLSEPAFQPIAGAAAGCTYFEPTGHQACGAFRSYWQAHGLELGDGGVSRRESLALFGYPLSEPFFDSATGLLTQYFERAVFELHPENPEPYTVLLRRLGAEELARWDW